MDLNSLSKVLKNPDMLGIERETVVKMTVIENESRYVQLTHQHMLFNDKEC